jgi:hypothetical protein
MAEAIKKTSTINIEIGLNEEQLPVDIQWSSSDIPEGPEKKAAGASKRRFAR